MSQRLSMLASRHFRDGGCHPGLEEIESWRKRCGMQCEMESHVFVVEQQRYLFRAQVSLMGSSSVEEEGMSE